MHHFSLLKLKQLLVSFLEKGYPRPESPMPGASWLHPDGLSPCDHTKQGDFTISSLDLWALACPGLVGILPGF